MIFRFGIRKGKSKSWEEIREEIIEAVEEEKRRGETLISISATGTHPHSESDKVRSSSATEDSYPLEE